MYGLCEAVSGPELCAQSICVTICLVGRRTFDVDDRQFVAELLLYSIVLLYYIVLVVWYSTVVFRSNLVSSWW